jgi:taurine transport system permease protein
MSFNPLLRLLPILALGLFWELFARSGTLTPFLLPQLSVVLQRVWVDVTTGAFFLNVGLTTYRALAGFTIAAVLGTSIGIAMSRSRGVRWFFDPIVSVGFPTPKIAFLPIFILWFGLFDASKIIMVAFACFFVITSNAFAGASGVDRQLIWSATSLGAGERQVLSEIVLPAALPQVISGLQIALPISMIVALVTEMIMGGGGLGGTLLQASRFADSVGVFASIIEIAVVGSILLYISRRIRGRLLQWHAESKGPAHV